MSSAQAQRASASKQRLFDAALRLVGERGAANVTVDEIASEAGVAKGTVYYNFGSKEALIEALLHHGVNLLAQRLAKAEKTQDASTILPTLVDNGLGFVAEYPAFAQLLVSELWRTPGQWHDTLALLRDKVVSIIKKQLQRISAAKKFPTTLPIDTAATALFGTLLVIALDWQTFKPENPQNDVRDSILLLLHGLIPQDS